MRGRFPGCRQFYLLHFDRLGKVCRWQESNITFQISASQEFPCSMSTSQGLPGGHWICHRFYLTSSYFSEDQLRSQSCTLTRYVYDKGSFLS